MINKDRPLIMHIDLNSCFATIEQQANRLLRGRPVAVSAYDGPGGMVLASSYEAKRLGIKLGVNNREAKLLAPDVVVLTPDPPKYREAHKRFRQILLDYTPDVTPKSIDEFVLDFSGSRLVTATDSTHEDHCKRMLELAEDIKQKIREGLGEWVTVNIGIATNRFLAKYGAGFNKPNGCTLIDHHNLLSKYEGMELVDLPGINIRYGARLKACGIKNPVEFLNADVTLLKKTVFKGVVGYYWWARLRGFEVDNRTFATKSIGHQYALQKKTSDPRELERLMMKLCEKVGRRLRKKNFCARGIHLYLAFEQRNQADVFEGVSDPGYDTGGLSGGFENMHKFRSWHEGKKLDYRLYASSDIFHAAKHLLDCAPIPSSVKLMAVTVYNLEPWDPEQLTIFDNSPISLYRSQEAKKRLSDAMDSVNNRYGEFVVTPGTMMAMEKEILDRVAFGNVPDLVD